MAIESLPASDNTQFNQFVTNYGLGDGGLHFELAVVRDGRAFEMYVIDIRELPDRADLLARMPEQWRERFLPVAHEARLIGALA